MEGTRTTRKGGGYLVAAIVFAIFAAIANLIRSSTGASWIIAGTIAVPAAVLVYWALVLAVALGFFSLGSSL